jgi:hypothetical protein
MVNKDRHVNFTCQAGAKAADPCPFPGGRLVGKSSRRSDVEPRIKCHSLLATLTTPATRDSYSSRVFTPRRSFYPS